MSASGENPRSASAGPGQVVRWSPNGQSIFFKGIGPREGSLWQHSVTTDEERKVADLLGRRGRLGRGLSTDGDHLYFTWEEDLGDIWVMDIVSDEQK